jgi:hypothetical protein
MSLDLHSVAPSEPAGYQSLGLRAGWGERIVTVVAASMAVLIVAVIAVLMGIAAATSQSEYRSCSAPAATAPETIRDSRARRKTRAGRG